MSDHDEEYEYEEHEYESEHESQGFGGFLTLPLRAKEKGFYFEASMADVFVMGFCLFFAILFGTLMAVTAAQLFGGLNGIFANQFPGLVEMHSGIDSFFRDKAPWLFTVIFSPFFVTGLYCGFYFGESALDSAWGSPLDQTASQKLISYWLVFTSVVPLAVAGAFIPMALTLSGKSWPWTVTAWVLTVPLASAFIATGYKILSNGFISWGSSFSGSFHASLPYCALTALTFGLAIPKFLGPGKGILFSTMAVFVWAIASSFCLYYGARIAVLAERETVEEHSYEDDWADDRSRKEVALIALLELTHRFSQEATSNKKVGLHPYELSYIAQVTPTHAMSVMDQLFQVGLVSIVNDGKGNMAILNINPEKVFMSDFLQRMEYPDDQEAPETLKVYSNKQFWSKYYGVIDQSFSSVSLQELYDSGQKAKSEKSVHNADDLKAAG